MFAWLLSVPSLDFKVQRDRDFIHILHGIPGPSPMPSRIAQYFLMNEDHSQWTRVLPSEFCNLTQRDVPFFFGCPDLKIKSSESIGSWKFCLLSQRTGKESMVGNIREREKNDAGIWRIRDNMEEERWRVSISATVVGGHQSWGPAANLFSVCAWARAHVYTLFVKNQFHWGKIYMHGNHWF